MLSRVDREPLLRGEKALVTGALRVMNVVGGERADGHTGRQQARSEVREKTVTCRKHNLSVRSDAASTVPGRGTCRVLQPYRSRFE